ncbi:LOW QUALITY PROTEIN: uncharacterized protein LOC18024078 [Eutrema salsugineum]|uniref:LOW QUALITY PROTEIN: uncharacterized protein LOC18024078 n=1 Tax=Eutrema salsugineum TaxID=72664 RepID=UPI000CED4525|nr:LOW QUALITY PROTEIN: uncharacterized protein LOC18024078 [Eutrema salsugineum]
MEIFKKAAIVRLRSHNEKNVIADEDQESVHQDRRGTTKNTRWTVEIIPGSNVIRLQSCYGKYLTATNIHFLLGATGKKVLQTLPEKLDSSAEWEPILSDNGIHVRFKSRYGEYLRANKGLPPWRNSITHDIPSRRTVTQDWILWSVDVLQIRVIEDDSDSSHTSSTFSRIQSGDSFTVTLPLKSEGRLIYYEIGDDCGNINNDRGKKSLIFHGSELTELKKKLEEETGIEDVMVCSRNPLTEKLCPLQLHLPPNNATMHIFNSSFLLHSVLRNDS